MSIFNNQFAKIRKDKGIGIKDIAKLLNMDYQAIKNYELSSAPRATDTDKWQKLCDVLGTTADELIGIHASNTNSANHPLLSAKSLPVLGKVSAGKGITAMDETIGRMNVPATWLKGKEDKYFILKVTGDSMFPRIPDGSNVLVSQQPDVESGSIAIVLIDNEEGVIKKVNKHKDYIELESFNPNYPERLFAKNEMNRLTIVGLVKKIIIDV